MAASNVLDRLFGRKQPPTADRLSTALDAARAKLADARSRIADAAQARSVAIASADRAGALLAKADAEAAEIDIEIAGPEIADLEKALADARKAEREDSQAQSAARLLAEGEAVERHHRAEWDAAVRTLARLRRAAKLHNLAVDNAEFSGAMAPGAVPRLSLAEEMKAFVTLDGATAIPPLPESARARAGREAAEEVARDRLAHEERTAAARAKSIEEGRARVQAEREAEAEKDRRQSYYPDWRATLDVAR